MNDKEVGELWLRRLAELELLNPDRKGGAAFKMDMVIGLIYKLVEERMSYWDDPGATLESFGIAYTTWKDETNGNEQK